MLRTLLALTVATALADVAIRTFDQDTPGVPPPGFTFSAARQPAPGRWFVRADGANQFLSHAADPGSSGFSLATLDATAPPRLRVSARLKLIDGERTGGLVWRYQDPDNYYLVSLDLRRQEIALYRVVRGNRIRLEEEDDLELDGDAWHTVRVVHDDDRIRVALGGIGVMRARDRALPAPGRAGLWSGGSTTGWFDDLRVEEEPEDQDRR